MDKQPPGQNTVPSLGKSDKQVSVELTHNQPQPSNVQPTPLPTENVINEPAPVVENTVEPESPWKFSDNDSKQAVNQNAPISLDKAPALAKPVNWSASEYIHHQKSFGWYAMLILAGGAIAAGVYLLTHDKISTGVVIFATLALAAYANHKPRVLNYKLDDRGLSIGDKFYKYSQFKSFSITTEGAFDSAILNPLKRFVPPLSIYFAAEDKDTIVNTLVESLPMEEHKLDAVDALIHRIRF